MKLFVTLFEPSRIEADHDGIELRAENLADLDLRALRASTSKPIILTYRGSRNPDLRAALDAGIDFVDVEWSEDVEIVAPERTVLSHHDYERMRDVEAIFAKMCARRCAHTKLAATPQTFADNQRLLALVEDRQSCLSGRGGQAGLPVLHQHTVIGMGERGLYARILAPFRGSELTFVAGVEIAAPGQLMLERALEIYGPNRAKLRAERVFAVAGNPAGHSLSPSIHNKLFREKRVSAAYTIVSLESFDEITDAFLRGEPCGLSVTAPFKEDALHFAERIGAKIAPNARRARAVNTLVNLGTHVLADNTDVDGFAALLPRARKAAVLGAGGTARAAHVALEDAGITATTFHRATLQDAAAFDGDLVINALPPGVEVVLPENVHVIEAAYGGGQAILPVQGHGPGRIACPPLGGLALLHAQAKRQHELFMQVFDGL